VGPSLAGFAAVGGLLGETRDVAEFFVVRSWRRRGIGTRAALGLIARFPGMWRIAFQEENPTAARFWRDVVRTVLGARYDQERRTVPDRPEVAPDVWTSFETAAPRG
jgi:predicted acetyltransferase